MLLVETIAKIRRAYFVDGRPIKAICRELGVSRKVVRKVIRSHATEFRYERETQPLPKMSDDDRSQRSKDLIEVGLVLVRSSLPRCVSKLSRQPAMHSQ